MSGYTPLFGSIFSGSLCGKWPDIAVFMIFLGMADKNGNVDVTPQFIAGNTGMPLELLNKSIEDLMKPDPMSRTPDEDGRRLALIDPARPWGWHIVNHAKYREKARKASFDAARVADGRNKERMRARKGSTESETAIPDATRADPPSYSYSDAYANKELECAPNSAPKNAPIPTDWKPNAKESLALVPDLDLDGEAEFFRSYYSSLGTPKADWDAEWLCWVNRCKGAGPYRKPPEYSVGDGL